jgi:hypothetical protein
MAGFPTASKEVLPFAGIETKGFGAAKAKLKIVAVVRIRNFIRYSFLVNYLVRGAPLEIHVRISFFCSGVSGLFLGLGIDPLSMASSISEIDPTTFSYVSRFTSPRFPPSAE